MCCAVGSWLHCISTRRKLGYRADEVSALQAALPSAPTPDKQAVQDKAVWYTTIGRLLVDPSVGSFARLWGATATTVLDGVAQQMTEELCGLQTQVDRCALCFD